MTEPTAFPPSDTPAAAAQRYGLKRDIYRRVRDTIWQMRSPDDVSELMAEIRRSLVDLKLPLVKCGVNVVDGSMDPPRVICYSLTPSGEHQRVEAVGVDTVRRFWDSQQVAYRRDLSRHDPYGERGDAPGGVGCIVDVPFPHGTLAVSGDHPNAFSADDVMVLEEMALLLEDGFRRIEERSQLEAQHRVREQVWKMRHKDDVVQVMVVLRETLEKLGVRYTACAINVVEPGPEGQTMRSHNMTREGAWQRFSGKGPPVVNDFWRSQEPAYRRDLDADDPHAEQELVSKLYGVHVRSIVDIPFAAGTLALNSTAPDAFTDEQIGFLQEMADVLGEAFRRVQDLEQLEERNQRLEMEVADRRRAEQRLASSLDEKVVLLKEIHHRVKNNLQVVSSLLNLSANSISDAEAKRQFDESRARIESMALVHERLYESEDLARIDCAGYLRALADNLLASYGLDPGRVRIEVGADPVKLDVDRALQCGLIVNELVANSLKHAFPDDRPGTVRVEMTIVDGRVYLSVIDDGVGLPVDIDYRQTTSLGLQLVVGLSTQLQGQLSCRGGAGAHFALDFPLVPARKDPVATSL